MAFLSGRYRIEPRGMESFVEAALITEGLDGGFVGGTKGCGSPRVRATRKTARR
jgi:hypothetical protein